MPDFSDVKVGDVVTRMLAGIVPIKLQVTEVDNGVIYCGERGVGWKFSAFTGAEIDEELDWGDPPTYSHTGSVLVKEN